MKLLITGGTGQLGRAFATLRSSAGDRFFLLGSRELDVTDPQQVDEQFARIRPDAVIHAAAYTDVDKAETEVDKAFGVNVLGTRNIAAACLNYDSKMAYISTDYVFDGGQERSYTEFDAANPLNVYGKSKLEGEKIAARICPRLFTVRTSWLYGDGRNFVRTILKLAQERPQITVVDDQIGTPTYTGDLAAGILALIRTDEFGTYHMANTGQCSWYEFATTILRLAGSRRTTVTPIATADLARPAMRPRYSALRNYMLQLAGRDCFRPWQAAIADYVTRLCS